MTEIIKTTYQLRRGTEAAWKKNNPVLAAGEPGFVIDKNILKIGDGVTPWNDLKEPNSDASNLSGTGSVYNAKTHYEFPNIGSSEVIYKAEEEKKIYQWNTTLSKYELLSEVDITVDNIQIIHGGNANGTT